MNRYSRDFAIQRSYQRAQAAYDAQLPPEGEFDWIDDLDLEGLKTAHYLACINDISGENDHLIHLLETRIGEEE